MIIDCHGHYTTAPRQHEGWRGQQIEAHTAGKPPPPRPTMTDDEIRETIEGGQLKLQKERRHRPDDLLPARRRHGPPPGRRDDQ